MASDVTGDRLAPGLSKEGFIRCLVCTKEAGFAVGHDHGPSPADGIESPAG
eukprot:CAMPEP_0182875546 /NCGR_PEP_ID=MMETSP0034_2-20130328/13608_1 /TAXON_ID=156128 /ORGANISM="Nephroselmis pyriformis, Strain CCMP717" /LENGTH=50 /DNA_ID=CAMNT_0025008291 /DNA_START=70 /DNA_END=218 /DNA_ORIENTATION=-